MRRIGGIGEGGRGSLGGSRGLQGFAEGGDMEGSRALSKALSRCVDKKVVSTARIEFLLERFDKEVASVTRGRLAHS